MVDSVDTKVLFSGENKYTVRITNVSDGTGEAAVTKIDRSSLIGPDRINAPNKIVVEEIQYDVQGFEGVKLYWESGATDELIVVMAGQGIKEYQRFGGLIPTTVGAAAEGDIILTTNGTAVAGDTYSILLICRLKE